ncbi:MAG: hypothetical protein AB1634_17830, partial [Thermodesulfobacteriota bacterium]
MTAVCDRAALAGSLQRLDAWCQAQDYLGWDVYDGLNSRLLAATPLYRSRLVRLLWIQLFKHLPVNLRPLARVPKADNPKALALFIAGLAAQGRSGEAGRLAARLLAQASPGYGAGAWGYPFPWQAR